MEIDWSKLYGGKQLKCISFLIYLFVKECYWIMDMKEGVVIYYVVISVEIVVLYLLVQFNIFDLLEQCFSLIFIGVEFFFIDYKVKGSWVMLGVVYFEMVYVVVMRLVRGIKEI